MQLAFGWPWNGGSSAVLVRKGRSPVGYEAVSLGLGAVTMRPRVAAMQRDGATGQGRPTAPYGGEPGGGEAGDDDDGGEVDDAENSNMAVAR